MEILPGIRPKEWWEEFWKNPVCGYGEPGKTLPRYASEFYGELSKNGVEPKAVDIGSGDGRYAIALAKIGYLVDAIEFTKSGVKRILSSAKDNGVFINAIQGDFTKLCEEERSYDIVISAGLIEEVNPSQHESIVQGFKNWVKVGGYVLLKYCLEIQGRGQLIKEGLVPNFFDQDGWKIIFVEEGKEMHPSRAKFTTEGGTDSAVRTGTLVAKRIK